MPAHWSTRTAARAWRSPDVAERFAAGLGEHLKPRGAALVVLSTFGDAQGFLEHYVAAVVYPPGLSRNLQVALGALALAMNVILYSRLLRRRR